MQPPASPGPPCGRRAARVGCVRAAPGPAPSPLYRSIVRSRPLGSGAALSALGSAPGPPRWPLPVRSRSPPDLLARRPRPGRSDPVPARRAAPAGDLRRRALAAPRSVRAPGPARRPRPPGSSFSSGTRGRREGARLGSAQTLEEVLAGGGPTRAVLPTAGLQTHCPEEETEVKLPRQRRA